MRLHQLLVVILPLAVAACGGVDMANYDYRQRHEVTVESRKAVATIARPAEGQALSVTDAMVLTDLAREHLRRSAGPVVIAAGKDDDAFAQSLAARLADAGVPADRIQIAVSETSGSATITVPVWTAKVPECGQWPDRVNPDFRNENTWNFGCSVTRNIGLMVSDPADLVRAREATGRDANRSVDVLTKYGQGKATGAEAEAQASGGLSTVGK
ncbi:MAG: CpaD family pilus assembly protein [Rhodospirillaceae bacterium]|nr:CpaD family pilus assembly protein [Rhodospirillales bacterium]